jgi:hypothetical protein
MLVKEQKAMYPRPLRQITGFNVTWLTYESRELAMQASLTAEQIASSKWLKGFDFGYQLPGEIKSNADGTFTVTVP